MTRPPRLPPPTRFRLAKDRDGTSVWSRLWQPTKARARQASRRRVGDRNKWTTILDESTQDGVADFDRCIHKMYDRLVPDPDRTRREHHAENAAVRMPGLEPPTVSSRHTPAPGCVRAPDQWNAMEELF